MSRRPRGSTLFPYTTLFRSRPSHERAVAGGGPQRRCARGDRQPAPDIPARHRPAHRALYPAGDRAPLPRHRDSRQDCRGDQADHRAMITIKTPREIETMAAAGRIVAETLALVGRSIRPDITTEDLDRLAETFIRSHPGAQPSFKGLYDFPATLCTSINQEIVHGIPSHKRVLHDADIVSIDVGVWLEGLHADSAATFPVGDITRETARLLEVTQQALAAGVAQARAGNHVGDIGHAVQQVAEKAGYSVVRELVGHGIGASFHEEPQVPNYGKPKRGPRLAPGMTIAIEPMINIGGSAIRTLDDKWTVVTQDGSLSAHFEHTVAVTDNGPRILTTA